MRSLLHRSTIPYGVWGTVIAAVSLIVLIFGVVMVTRVHAASGESVASGDHLITIHDNGQDRGILTSATTLRAAFKEAGIPISTHDMVEPSLDETLVASHYDVNVYRARPVTVVDGNLRTKIMSPYQTPEQIAEHANIELQDEDITDISMNTDIVRQGAGLELTITRATPFTFVMYGKKIDAYTQADTVGDMLAAKDITLGEKDELSVAADTPITAGMTVKLWRNGKQTITVDEKIPFEVEQIQDVDREVGYKDIKTPGVAGKRTVSYEVVMQNGEEISRKEIRSVTIKQPTKQVEVVGAKPSFSGDFGAALAKLRACESGGNYANKNNPLYRGAYQFGYGTWGNKYGIYDPADASPAQQDQAARELYERRGWQPWPHCGANLPDTYR
ncbi:MAG TPA: ubiquitin-like domain-containing protein [Candidatus Saccharimonadales bacterium]|nr:ubiquitin-like domain-containing protein [Candidatus Saccharimonadales bacterium]